MTLPSESGWFARHKLKYSEYLIDLFLSHIFIPCAVFSVAEVSFVWCTVCTRREGAFSPESLLSTEVERARELCSVLG